MTESSHLTHVVHDSVLPENLFDRSIRIIRDIEMLLHKHSVTFVFEDKAATDVNYLITLELVWETATLAGDTDLLPGVEAAARRVSQRWLDRVAEHTQGQFFVNQQKLQDGTLRIEQHLLD